MRTSLPGAPRLSSRAVSANTFSCAAPDLGRMSGAIFLWVCISLVWLGACAETEEPSGSNTPSGNLLVGNWHIEDPVSPRTAVFTAEGEYEVTIDFGQNPFVEVGTWSISETHYLQRLHGASGSRIQNTESCFVDQGRLVIGGVLLRSPGQPDGIEGEWVQARTVDQDTEGALLFSNRITQTLMLNSGGSGRLTSLTERANPDTGTPEPSREDMESITWSMEGANLTLTGTLAGTYEINGDLLVRLGQPYMRN